MYKIFSKTIVVIITFGGALVFVGWIFDIPILKSISPVFVTMKINTALSFVLVGVSLWLLADHPDKWQRRFAYICVFIVSLISFLSLCEYLFQWDLGIDQLLFKDSPGAVGTYYPGRIAPITAINFILIGMALILLDKETPKGRRPAQYLMLPVAYISLVVIVNYIYGVKAPYGPIMNWTPMAIYTAILFFIVFIAVFISRPNRGLMIVISGRGIGSFTLRRLMPLLFIPVIVEGIKLFIVKYGLIGERLGGSLEAAVIITVFIPVLYHVANRLNELEQIYRKTEASLISSESHCRKLFEEAKENEEKYRAFYEFSSDAIMIFDPAFSRFIKGNKATLKMFDLNDEKEFISLTPWDLSPEYQPDGQLSKDKARKMIDKVLKEETVFFEWAHKKPSGETFIASVLLTKVKIGENILLQATVRDITKSKRLYEDTKRLSMIVEQGPVSVIVTDLEGNIRYVNSIWSKLSGYAFEEVKGKNISILKTGVIKHKLFEELWETIKSGGVWHGEICNKRKDGDIYWILAYISGIKDEKGVINSYQEVAIDITERKFAQEVLKKSRDDLEIRVKERTEELTKISAHLKLALQVKSEFLANMSHELRTPLNSVIGFSEVLYDQTFGPLNEKQREYLNYVLVSGKHLLSLINDVLDLAKVEAGKMELVLSAFSLKSLLEESVILVKGLAFKKNITLSLEIPEDIPIINADERKLKEILYNLLSNAIKFTPEGGKAGMKALKMPSEIEVEVWDTGIGIAPENIERIFEAFTRIETSYSKLTEGTGLGLAFSKKLVELHGGRIWVESGGLHKGTQVRFTLPIK